MHRVVQIMDCTILCGHRDEEAQNKAIAEKASKTPYPQSKHNKYPSHAVDISPWPIPEDWDPKAFILLAGVVKAEAHHLGLKVRWGGDWDSDDDLTDQKFNDYVHFEIAQ
jgi:hypothetical protein